MKLAHINLVDVDKSVLYFEFHVDLSGPVDPSIGGNAYIIHSIELTSSMSDVRIMKQRRDTSAEVKWYINMLQ